MFEVKIKKRINTEFQLPGFSGKPPRDGRPPPDRQNPLGAAQPKAPEFQANDRDAKLFMHKEPSPAG